MKSFTFDAYTLYVNLHFFLRIRRKFTFDMYALDVKVPILCLIMPIGLK